MAIRIQLKRDLAQNWTLHNPILLNGEIGIETDTLKFKIGNGGRWNDQASYAFKLGEANGVAVLNSAGKLSISQLPDSFSINADIANALSLLSTTNLPEGTNKYFTNARAISAVGTSISDAILLEVAARNAAIATAKTEVTNTASADATTKAASAKSEAITASEADATAKSNAARTGAISASATATDSKISAYALTVNSAIDSAVNTEAIARNAAITSATGALTTSNIAEGSRLYFTNARAVAALTGSLTTTGITEGSNLYFTNARAVSALNAKTSEILGNALDAVDALDIKITGAGGSIDTAIDAVIATTVPEADRNISGGFAGLDSNGLLQTSAIPSTIARVSDISNAVSSLVNSAPGALDTLGELASALQSNESGITALTTSIGLKLSTADAASTYATITNLSLKAPIASPTFTGTVTIPAGASISGYLTTANAASTYLTIANAASSYVTSTGLQNTLTAGGYLEEADRNVASGFAGVTAGGYILPSLIESGAITNEKLLNSQITINGNAVSLGGNLTVTAGYSNSNTSIGSNVISYGTSATPPSGTAVGDIYIQY
jgi:hypothetical protein